MIGGQCLVGRPLDAGFLYIMSNLIKRLKVNLVLNCERRLLLSLSRRIYSPCISLIARLLRLFGRTQLLLLLYGVYLQETRGSPHVIYSSLSNDKFLSAPPGIWYLSAPWLCARNHNTTDAPYMARETLISANQIVSLQKLQPMYF